MNFLSSLYIHIPWCIKKCPYCDFNSHEIAQLSASEKKQVEQKYKDCLLKDLNAELYFWGGQSLTLKTIFIGGGTPSILSPDFYQDLLESVAVLVPFDPEIEITMEANPGTIDAAFFTGYKAAGITRLSMGVQSFNDAILQKLGRIHNASDVERSFAVARDAGFNNINIDIMHGLPDQDINKALDDLDGAINLQPEHLSWYQLTIEPNTIFFNQQPVLPNENILDDIYERGIALLSKAGFQQYEVSAFSKQGMRSRHNLNYWQFGDYIGIGAGAHGKLSINGRVHRRWKKRMPASYMADTKNNTDMLAGQKIVVPEELPLEYTMNHLRLLEGFWASDFELKTGLHYSVIAATVGQLQKKGLLDTFTCEGDIQVKVSTLGLRYLDSVLMEFSND